MLLQFHYNYLLQCVSGKDEIKAPQYLHLVFASEDQEHKNGLANLKDTCILQESLMEEMNKGMKMM